MSYDQTNSTVIQHVCEAVNNVHPGVSGLAGPGPTRVTRHGGSISRMTMNPVILSV